MKKQLKRLVVLAVAMTMFVSSALSVSAAGLRDVFDAKHYADTYKDLKAAFGDNEELLYQHFINYGLKEKRQMSPIIDLQAYRAAYPDLEAAFGDNWDAYVEHFFMFGAKENRTKGVLFNPLKYAAAYPDVAAAFGSDLKAITKHFLTFGIKEGRTAGVVVKAPAAAPSGGSGSGGSQSGGGSGGVIVKIPTALSEPAVTPTPTNLTVTYTDGAVTIGEDGHDIDSFITTVSGNSTANAINSLTVDATSATETTISTTVSGNVIKAIAEANEGKVGTAAITVKSSPAIVTVPLAALTQVGGGENTPVEIAIATVSANTVPKTDVYGQTVSTNNLVAVDVSLKVGGVEQPVSGLSGNNMIQIEVDAPDGVTTGSVYVYYVKGNKLEPVGVATASSGKVKFAIDHLTQFVFSDKGHNIAAADHTAEMFKNKAGQVQTTCQLCGLTQAQHKEANACVDTTPKDRKCDICGGEVHPKGNAALHTKADFSNEVSDTTKTCVIGASDGCVVTVEQFQTACGNRENGHTGSAGEACANCGMTIPAQTVDPGTSGGGDVSGDDELFEAHSLEDFDESSGACENSDVDHAENCEYTLTDYQDYCKNTANDEGHKDELTNGSETQTPDGLCDRCGDTIHSAIIASHNKDTSFYTDSDTDAASAAGKNVGDCKTTDCNYSLDTLKSNCETAGHAGGGTDGVAATSGETCSVCGVEVS